MEVSVHNSTRTCTRPLFVLNMDIMELIGSDVRGYLRQRESVETGAVVVFHEAQEVLLMILVRFELVSLSPKLFEEMFIHVLCHQIILASLTVRIHASLASRKARKLSGSQSF